LLLQQDGKRQPGDPCAGNEDLAVNGHAASPVGRVYLRVFLSFFP
jgi:hypothetical protein